MKGLLKVAKFFNYQADDFTWLQIKQSESEMCIMVNRTNKTIGAETMVLTTSEAFALKDLLNLILTKGNENGARETSNGSTDTRIQSVLPERVQN